MPYSKKIGQSPKYHLGYKTIDYDQNLANFLKCMDVPFWAPGITYQDSFDGYVERAKRWSQTKRWTRCAFKTVYS